LLAKLIPEEWSWLIYFNPIAGFLELFRAVVFNGEFNPMIWISIGTSICLFTAGILFFIRTDKKMADLL
ncbi:MAG: hypothetical protein ACPF9D_12685, partial [Owenweeksia sp.]